jgi:putative ABC transport system permease protein
MYQQIMFLRERETGYDRENLMMVWTNDEMTGNYQTLKNELLTSGLVSGVTKSNSPITSIFANNVVEWPGMEPGTQVVFSTIATEYDYVKTMGIKLLEGRDFSAAFNDSTNVIINKAASDIMGLTDPVGSTLTLWDTPLTIIGVVDDVVMSSPYEPVAPLVIIFEPDWTSTLSLRLAETDDPRGAINQVESLFRKYNPTHPFEFRFADVEFDKKFASIALINNLAKIFATLAILITALGLFGLAAFTAEQRSKEISIRKVLGATVSGLVMLMAKDFTRLVIIAFVLFAPLGWWLLSGFLEQYPYRITIAWWIMPSAGLAALVIAVTIVSTQAIRAASSNPVTNLRNE